MSFAVLVQNEKIVKAPPVVYTFRGQFIGQLLLWMRRQGGFRMERMCQ